MNASQYTSKPELGPQYQDGDSGEGRQQHHGEPRVTKWVGN